MFTHPVNSNITIFTARSERLAVRVDRNRVNGTAAEGISSRSGSRNSSCDSQVTSYTTDFLLEHTMPEPSLELSASCACGGDTSGILTTSNNHIRLERGDDCAVERSFRGEGLDDGKVLGVMYLISKVKRSVRCREQQNDRPTLAVLSLLEVTK